MRDIDNMTRRSLVKAGILGLAALPLKGFATNTVAEEQQRQRPPALSGELVRAFVGAGHGDLDKVKTMLAAEPGLLNATWDWGGGDFETAIGGAGHMGRADIAKYLIGQGARYDIFVAAMLGELNLVRAALDANPTLIDSKGPHGISLMTHAEKGAEDAKNVVEFLKSRGS